MLPEVNLNLAEFGISSGNGFLPDEFPLTRLPGTYYQPWEDLISALPILVKERILRSRVDELPVLSVSYLTTEAEWQRAYVILGFLTHAYIWCGPIASQTLPPQVAIPFLAVADHFDLPTTAAYAATNLWNFAPLSSDWNLCDPDHLRSLTTFTGTKDEEWFYLISVAMEARGGSIVASLLSALEAADAEMTEAVTKSLLSLATTLNELGILLDRMYEHCDPYVFYYDIRPMLAGSKNMGHAGLPKGVFYEEGDGKGQWREYSGGSNAQSSLIQFFDIILGVEHKATGELDGKKKLGFLKEMRRYMPAPHARFLTYLSSIPSLRTFVLRHSLNHEITEAYNAAVAELSRFRDKHIQIVTRYIILPSKNPRKAPSVETSVNLATVSLSSSATKMHDEKAAGGLTLELHGTGGTALIPFLKQTRDETANAARL